MTSSCDYVTDLCGRSPSLTYSRYRGEDASDPNINYTSPLSTSKMSFCTREVCTTASLQSSNLLTLLTKLP